MTQDSETLTPQPEGERSHNPAALSILHSWPGDVWRQRCIELGQIRDRLRIDHYPVPAGDIPNCSLPMTEVESRLQDYMGTDEYKAKAAKNAKERYHVPVSQHGKPRPKSRGVTAPEDMVLLDRYKKEISWQDGITFEQFKEIQVRNTAKVLGRRVNLKPFLDGTYQPLIPSVGECRDCGHQMLYPERWHTVIALNASGKSWFALWHVVGELRAGNTVAYAHFEETNPMGTIDRLRLMAPELTADEIQERFIWLDCSQPWQPGEFGAALPEKPSLVILDGINAASSQHGYDASDIKAPGAYRALFVTPAVKRGAAVLSLGHPPKARDRQGERHGFGSTAWLDEVDGVGFRMEASQKRPIRRGEDGYAMVWTVKDRYGQVEALGALDSDRDSGWYKLGAFHVDATDEGKVRARMGLLDLTEGGQEKDKLDHLGEAILAFLQASTGRFESQRELDVSLKAARVAHRATDLAPALSRLAQDGLIVWPEVGTNKARPGWVTAGASDSAFEFDDED